MQSIIIRIRSVTIEAELMDTPTGKGIWEALPIQGSVNTWGDEIYFNIPVSLPLEPDAREVVSVGDLAYWPPGKAFCIFFGPTPMSMGDEIRPASAVNVFGKARGDLEPLKSVDNGETILIEKSSL